MKNILVLDIGGTKINVGLVNEHNKLLWRKKYPTIRQPVKQQDGHITPEFQKNLDKRAVLDNIIGIITQHYSPSLSAISLAIAGQVDPIKKTIFFSHNFPKALQRTISLGEILEQKFHLPVFMDNDANCFALGESYYGQGKQYRYVLGLTIGTGLGSSLIIDQQIYRGRCNGIEFGHILIEKNDSLKLLENYFSGSGLINLYQQETNQLISTIEIIKRAKQKELAAKKSLKRFYDYLKLGIINAILSFDPDIVILGGGMSQADLPWKKIIQETKQEIHLPAYRQVKIVRSKNPDNIILLGASLLIKNNVS